MSNNLPVIATFLEALSFPYNHYRALLKVGLPLIITGGVLIILNQLFSVNEEDFVQIAFILLLAITFLLSLVMAIVGCHRVFLLGESVTNESTRLNWTGNEIKYIGWWILIGICTALISIPFMFLLLPLMAPSLKGFFEGQLALFVVISLINIPIYYVASRWSLVLPSSAIDIHGKNLTWSWELSTSNGWRLTLLIGFLPFMTDMVFSFLPTYDSVLFNLFHGSLWLVVGVIEIGLLSLSYKFLVSKKISDNALV